MKTRRIVATLALGLGMAVASLWLLGGGMSNVARAQGPDGHDTYYVAPGANCGGMMPCYGNVQAAVDAVDDPDDVVKIAASTYTGVSAREGVTQAVYISKTVTIQGGYIITNWTTSDPDANPTTLDALGQGRVLYITGDISPTVEGLRITGGDAAGLGGSPWGSDCGGGVYLYQRDANSAATFSNNQVFNNVGGSHGGGLCVRFSAATISGNTVFSNTASSGGGLWLDNSAATLSGNTVSSNTADSGGGLYLYSGADTLNGNTIISNTANDGGGGLYLDGSAATLSSNTVGGNTANGTNSWDGGGGLLLRVSAATLINNVVVDNQANILGGGLRIRGSSPRLLHTTIARNGDSSGVYVTDEWGTYSTVALTNTILVSHTVGISVTEGNTVTVNAVLWHGTLITVSQPATATVMMQNQHEGDPAFAPDGYHLTVDSAAIGKGVDAGIADDLDGDPRLGAPDIGADEYVRYVYLPLVVRNYQP